MISRGIPGYEVMLLPLDSGSPLSSSSEMHYEVTSCGRSYHQLCCKAGVEMELMFKPGNEKYE